MSRIDSPWPVREVHGIVRWATPVTQPCVVMTELVTARARRQRWAKRVLAGLLAVLAGALWFGCAHRPEVIVLSEREGKSVGRVIAALVGQMPKAVTAPGLPTIVFQPEDANDPGLLAHERCHKRQQMAMGEATWTATYLHQLGACETRLPRAECLRTMDLEAECYAVQRACRDRGECGDGS